MTKMQVTEMLGILTALGTLVTVSSGVHAANSTSVLGVFSPTNHKSQHVYEDRVIASDRLKRVINKRKSQIDGCAAVLNGERGEYASYYKVPSGSVAIEMNLDQTGKLTSTRIARDTLPDPKVADCLHRQVKDLKVDVAGLKEFQLKKYLVFEINCHSEKADDTTVQDRCSGSSELYDKISVP